MTVNRIINIKERDNVPPQADSAFLQRIGVADSYTTMQQIEEYISPAKQADFLAKVSDLEDKDLLLETSIAEEKTARENADTALQTNIEAEESARIESDETLQTHIDAEAQSRSDADATLQGEIDDINGALETLNGDAETDGSVAKAVADGIASVIAEAPEDLDTLKEISDWISTHADDAAAMNTAIQDNATAIENEELARIESDETLQTNIDAEAQSRSDADATLQGEIDDINGALETLNGDAETDRSVAKAVSDEATARTEADSELQKNIDAETTARSSSDENLRSDIISETTARAGADEVLQTNIDALQNALSQETSARKQGDADVLSKLTETFGDQVSEIANEKVDEVINERMAEYDTAIETQGAAIATLQNAGNYNKKYYEVDLSSLSTGKFYPVTFGTSDLELDCEIHSPNLGGAQPYNQNHIHFLLTRQGWSDTRSQFVVLSYGVYDSNEITIGCIGAGLHTGVNCVWLRGGMKYRFICNRAPALRTSAYTVADGTNSYEQFTIGENYYGDSNTNVSVVWSPLGKNRWEALEARVAALEAKVG